MSETTAPDQMVSAVEVNALLPPGASLSQEAVDAVVAAIQAECGWHIAPSKTETIYVDSLGGPTLQLPTLHMTELISVVATETDEPLPISLETGWSEAGTLALGSRTFIPGGTWKSARRSWNDFPAGFRAVKVTFTHGYEKCPVELVRLIATASHRRILSETLVGRAVTFEAASELASIGGAGILSKYTLGPRA